MACAVFFAASAVLADEAADGPSLGALKQLSVEQLMDIEVTSVAKEPEKLLDAPAAIDVVTGDDIRRSGASSIPEALQLADNLDVDQKNAHDWAISARGFNTALGNKLLVLMDGRTLYTPLFSRRLLGRPELPLGGHRPHRVISGPGGALWGANAVNGVINISTKSAQDNAGPLSRGGRRLGAARGPRGRATAAPSRPACTTGSTAQYDDRGPESLPDGTNAADAWHTGQGGFRIDAGTTPQNTLTLQGDAYGADEGEEIGAWPRRAARTCSAAGRTPRSRTTPTSASRPTTTTRPWMIRFPASAAPFKAAAGILSDGLGHLRPRFPAPFTLGVHTMWPGASATASPATS